MTPRYHESVTLLAERLIGREDAGAVFRELLEDIYAELRSAGVGHDQAYAAIDKLGDEVVAEVERLVAPPRVLH